MTVLATKTTTLECEFELGDPKADVKWFRDGKEVSGGRYKPSIDGRQVRLTITDTKLTDAGRYKCTLVNKISSCETSCTLTVQQKPAIEYEKKYESVIAIKAGRDLLIPLKVTGIPTPKTTWTLNANPLESNVKIDTKNEDMTVSVRSTKRSDSGKYKIIAENAVGSADAEFEVVIKDKPSAPRSLSVEEVQKESISISWQAPEDDGGAPITDYIIEKKDSKKTSWSSAGKVKANQLDFTVPKLVEGNEYYLRVTAVNEIGEGEPAQTKDPVKAKSKFGELSSQFFVLE